MDNKKEVKRVHYILAVDAKDDTEDLWDELSVIKDELDKLREKGLIYGSYFDQEMIELIPEDEAYDEYN